jgi:hypothetical protein
MLEPLTFLVPLDYLADWGIELASPLWPFFWPLAGSRDFLVSDIGAKEKPRRAIYGACRGIWTRRARE